MKLLNTSSFKPCYKWNTFNTGNQRFASEMNIVLNLVISGIPSILNITLTLENGNIVLNLIITGMPSIQF